MKNYEEYVYARIKNINVNDDGDAVLFIYAGLTLNTIKEDSHGRNKHVRPLVSNIIELPEREALPVYLAMDNQEVRYIVDLSEFRFLFDLFTTNLTAFMTYSPAK